MLTIPLTIRQQVWRRGSKTAGERRESGRVGREHINRLYFLLWNIFDTLRRRIWIHLHTRKSQFPKRSLPCSNILSGKIKRPTLRLAFSCPWESISKADFFFFFFPLWKQSGLDSEGYDLRDEYIHLPWHKQQNTQLSRTHCLCPFELGWKQTHLLYTHANGPLQDVSQPCTRRKLYLNPQVCVKEQENSSRTDWIKINSFKNTLTV